MHPPESVAAKLGGEPKISNFRAQNLELAAVRIVATATITAKTGVEMEAYTAVAVAATPSVAGTLIDVTLR